jgi:hypothetical protein
VISLKAKISFFDPHTQQPYTIGEDYPLIDDNTHLEWLMQHGLIVGDKATLGSTSQTTPDASTDQETPDPEIKDQTTPDASTDQETPDPEVKEQVTTDPEKPTKKRDKVTADGDDTAGK